MQQIRLSFVFRSGTASIDPEVRSDGPTIKAKTSISLTTPVGEPGKIALTAAGTTSTMLVPASELLRLAHALEALREAVALGKKIVEGNETGNDWLGWELSGTYNDAPFSFACTYHAPGERWSDEGLAVHLWLAWWGNVLIANATAST